MKNKLFYLLILIIATASLWLIVDERINNKSDGRSVDNQQFTSLKLGNQTFLAEIAKTEKERERGLSGKNSLPEDFGMLFVFNKPDKYLFWMKEMNFPIDIIWLNENKKIVDITTNLATSTYPNTVTSQTSALYVFEINAGLADKYNFKIGDSLDFKIN